MDKKHLILASSPGSIVISGNYAGVVAISGNYAGVSGNYAGVVAISGNYAGVVESVLDAAHAFCRPRLI